MNYDLIIDYSLFYTGTKYRYGFEKIEDQWNRIDLLKLHGSLNWGREKNTGNIHVAGFGGEYDVYGHGSVPTAIDTYSGEVRLKVHTEKGQKDIEYPFIIPPSTNKISKQGELKQIWSLASSALNQAEVIIFIGYSVPESDRFFKDFFALSTYGPSDFEKIVVVNPDPASEGRVASLISSREIDLGILEYHQIKFEECIEIVESIIKDYETDLGVN